MEKIYSKLEPDKLLHIVYRLEDFSERSNIVPDENFIQCASLRMQKGTTFKAHKHIRNERSYKDKIAQESWVVIRGTVRCIFYDTDDTVIATPILNAGDASFTLEGGHTYEILEDDTYVYEYKTGPYEGQANDKVFLNAP
jgi:cupin fold WbuC family metalloprotein